MLCIRFSVDPNEIRCRSCQHTNRFRNFHWAWCNSATSMQMYTRALSMCSCNVHTVGVLRRLYSLMNSCRFCECIRCHRLLHTNKPYTPTKEPSSARFCTITQLHILHLERLCGGSMPVSMNTWPFIAISRILFSFGVYWWCIAMRWSARLTINRLTHTILPCVCHFIRDKIHISYFSKCSFIPSIVSSDVVRNHFWWFC